MNGDGNSFCQLGGCWSGLDFYRAAVVYDSHGTKLMAVMLLSGIGGDKVAEMVAISRGNGGDETEGKWWR